MPTCEDCGSGCDFAGNQEKPCWGAVRHGEGFWSGEKLVLHACQGHKDPTGTYHPAPEPRA